MINKSVLNFVIWNMYYCVCTYRMYRVWRLIVDLTISFDAQISVSVFTVFAFFAGNKTEHTQIQVKT